MFRTVFLVASVSLASQAQRASAFGPGEQTTYAVSYLGLTAGTATLSVGWDMQQSGSTVWPLICVGETSRWGAVFPVKDKFVSYWDPAAKLPVGADFFVAENKFRQREHFAYDRSVSQAKVTRQRPNEESSERTHDISADTLDLASAGFALRNLDFKVGEVHEFPIFTGLKTYQLKATVLGQQELETALGTLSVFKVSVNGDFSGSLATKGLMNVYYTADERHLPVRAEAEFVLGTVALDVVKYLPGRI
jgi:Protein of unknown function (DUF3108)